MAILAAGCGSSQEGTDRAEFIEKADRICAEGNRKIHQSISPSVKGDIGLPMPIGSATAVKKVIVPELADELRGLRSIAPPAADAAEVEEFLEFLAAMRLMIVRAVNNPPYVAKVPRPFLRTELMGKRYGFKVCGNV
ncbi:MAG TPA: hypothetical protein VKC63_12630 [Solirubrobacterales bacterium]|nr:hypothetical protein [Solirubrobacterales bacterium]